MDLEQELNRIKQNTKSKRNRKKERKTIEEAFKNQQKILSDDYFFDYTVGRWVRKHPEKS